jgi:hypothetical protein
VVMWIMSDMQWLCMHVQQISGHSVIGLCTTLAALCVC